MFQLWKIRSPKGDMPDACSTIEEFTGVPANAQQPLNEQNKGNQKFWGKMSTDHGWW